MHGFDSSLKHSEFFSEYARVISDTDYHFIHLPGLTTNHIYIFMYYQLALQTMYHSHTRDVTNLRFIILYILLLRWYLIITEDFSLEMGASLVSIRV